MGCGSDTCKRGIITGFRGYAEVQDIDFSASSLGKGKTTSQTVTILMILGGFAIHGSSMANMFYAEICFWMMMLATFLTVASGMEYVVRLRNALTQNQKASLSEDDNLELRMIAIARC